MKSAEQLLGIIFRNKKKLMIPQAGHYPQEIWNLDWIIDRHLMQEVEEYLKNKKLRDDNEIDRTIDR